MKKDITRLVSQGSLIILLAAFSQISQAVVLFAHGNDDQLYLVDTDAVSATVVGPTGVSLV